MSEAADRWRKDWRSEDGLGRLDPNDHFIPAGYKLTVKNDNGILFAAMAYYAIYKNNALVLQDKVSFIEAVDYLTKEPGLYHRKAHAMNYLEAHDNYDGIAAGSVLCGSDHARDIVHYGQKHGYCYNNVEPGVYKIEAQRQGGSIAFYKLCAGYVPALWELIWLCIGIVAGMLQKKHVSSHQLIYLKMEAIKVKGTTHLPNLHNGILTIMLFIYSLWLKKAGGLKGIVSRYYQHKEHPIHDLA